MSEICLESAYFTLYIKKKNKTLQNEGDKACKETTGKSSRFLRGNENKATGPAVSSLRINCRAASLSESVETKLFLPTTQSVHTQKISNIHMRNDVNVQISPNFLLGYLASSIKTPANSHNSSAKKKKTSPLSIQNNQAPDSEVTRNATFSKCTDYIDSCKWWCGNLKMGGKKWEDVHFLSSWFVPVKVTGCTVNRLSDSRRSNGAEDLSRFLSKQPPARLRLGREIYLKTVRQPHKLPAFSVSCITIYEFPSAALVIGLFWMADLWWRTLTGQITDLKQYSHPALLGISQQRVGVTFWREG